MTSLKTLSLNRVTVWGAGVRTSTYECWGDAIQSITAPKDEEDEEQQEDHDQASSWTPLSRLLPSCSLWWNGHRQTEVPEPAFCHPFLGQCRLMSYGGFSTPNFRISSLSPSFFFPLLTSLAMLVSYHIYCSHLFMCMIIFLTVAGNLWR